MEYVWPVVVERWLVMMMRACMFLIPMALVFWIIRPKWTQKFRIHQPREAKTRTKEEIPRTIMGLSVFMIPVAANVIAREEFGYSMMYTDVDQYGWAYLVASIFIFAFIVDTWFYWAHRLMHTVPFLKKAHNVHHRSYNPTPATSYSFDVVEALINMAPYIIIVLCIPWHPLALLIFSSFGIFYVGYIHLGYDFGFNWRKKNFLTKWFYSSTHHSIHHQIYDGNFAVYFTFWDKLMKTEIESANRK